MNTTHVGILGMAALFALLALRMPVGIAMFLVGVVGFGAIQGWPAAFATLGRMPFEYSQSYDLSVIPLFVLMGNLCTASGASRDLYRLAHAWIGHWKGGLASATVAACAGFAAVSGSSLATAVTIGTVALPEMDRYKYDPRLATGVVAAGGTLGILIPPSTGFIVYGLLTEQSIGRLFLAGFIPGLVLAGLFIAAIAIMTALRPAYGPPGERASWSERAVAIERAGAMLGIAVISIGGIYVGIFTATEAAAVGAFLTVLLVAWRSIVSAKNGRETLAAFAKLNGDALRDTIRTTTMVFLILIGAQMFTPFLAVTHIPENLAGVLNNLDMPPLAILLILLVIYVILGMFMEGFSMLVLTIPIVFPIITALGYDPIWFGVVMVIVLEMGLITPPVGLNVYVIRGIAPDVPMARIFQGSLPFLAAMVLCIALLIAYPQIALFLPNSMIR